MIYVYLLVTIIVLSKIKKKYGYNKSIDFFLAALFSLVYGLRYDVGIDFLAYSEYYYAPYGSKGTREFIYDLSIRIFRYFDMPFWTYTLFTGILIFVLLYLISKNLSIDYDKVLLFFVLTGQLFVSFNLVRQTVACLIIMYAFKYIIQEKYFRFIIFILIGTLIHNSAIVLLPIALVCKIKFDLKHAALITITGIIFYIVDILAVISVILLFTKYGKYLGGTHDYGVNFGLGVVMFILIGLYIVIRYKELDIKTKPFIICYIAANSLFLFTIRSFIVHRLTRFAYIAIVPVLPLVLCSKKTDKLIYKYINNFIIFYYVITFIRQIMYIYINDYNNLMYQTIVSLSK